MNRLIGYLVVAAGCFAFSGPISAWMPSRNEATVYMLSCDEKPVDGVCRGTEMTVVPLTYRVLADQNSVSYWETDDPGRPQLLAVERRPLEQIGQLRPVGDVVQLQLLVPRARLDLGIEQRHGASGGR